MLTRQRLIGIILSGQLAGQRLKILDILRRPPVGQCAGLVILRTLIVELMALFMTDDRADPAIVDLRIGVGIEESRLEGYGGKHSVDHVQIGLEIDTPWGLAPFTYVDGVYQQNTLI